MSLKAPQYVSTESGVQSVELALARVSSASQSVKQQSHTVRPPLCRDGRRENEQCRRWRCTGRRDLLRWEAQIIARRWLPRFKLRRVHWPMKKSRGGVPEWAVDRLARVKGWEVLKGLHLCSALPPPVLLVRSRPLSIRPAVWRALWLVRLCQHLWLNFTCLKVVASSALGAFPLPGCPLFRAQERQMSMFTHVPTRLVVGPHFLDTKH